MSPDRIRRSHAVSLQQAAHEAPTLAALTARVRESGERLLAVESLIPAALRPAIQAGPIDGGEWCLLVSGSAAAGKLRQLLPALQSCLRQRGWQVDAIRIKVLMAKR
jgi:hypothetical protein